MTELVITTPEALYDITIRALRVIQGETGVKPYPGNTPWLTTDEAAEYLKMSKDDLYHMAAAGEVPASKLGRRWRFHRDKLDEWLHQS